MSDDAESNSGDAEPATGLAARSIMDDDLIWALIDAAPDALIVTDDSGCIELVNRRAEELFGYSRADLLGRSVDMLVPVVAQNAHLAHRTLYHADPARRPMGTGLDLRAARADGTDLPVEISLSPVRSGDRLRIIAAVRDVTNRLEAERHSQAVLHATDTAVDGIFITDEKTMEFTYVNRRGAEMHGYTVDEVLGMTPGDLAPHLDHAEIEREMAPLIAGDVADVTLTTIALRRDGHEFPVEVHTNHPPAVEEGNPRPFVSVVRDISERVQTERELANSRAFNSIVEERERMARDLHDRVIGELVGVGMKVQATVARIPDPVAVERLQESIDELEDIIGLIRTTIFRLNTQPSDTTHHRLLEDRVDSLRDRVGHEPKLTMTGAIEALPDYLVNEISVVIDEALTNIAKHAEASVTDITVEVQSDHLVVTVIDDGNGLPPIAFEEMDGFGLRNLQARAENHGGECSIRSKPAEGVEVRWAVPVDP